MTRLEGEARAEAMRRYRLSRVEQDNAASLAELNERISAGNGFIAGAVWGASRKPSEAEVEAALKVLDAEGFLPTNARGNEHYEGYWRGVVKMALTAARTARGEQHG